MQDYNKSLTYKLLIWLIKGMHLFLQTTCRHVKYVQILNGLGLFINLTGSKISKRFSQRKSSIVSPQRIDAFGVL